MPSRLVRNSGGVPFLVLKGYFVVRERQQPDGDTLAFAAGAKYSAGRVRTNVPLSTSGETVNIRLQSIDAPEKSQPLGATCRDALLKHMGFDPADFGLSDTDFTAAGDTQKVPGWLATHDMDGNRRPLGYVFRANPGFTHGKIVSAADVRDAVKSSANYAQAAKGWAFPAFYDNTDESHAALFAQAARKARADEVDVWRTDATTQGFVPTKDALGISGALVYPKFYRRVSKWKTAKPNAQSFVNWLKKQDDGKKLVQGAQPSPVPLWQLFEVASTRKVAVPYDVARLWFSE